jgi:hypothetical protein
VGPRIRIKYCGGCNPQYDRVALMEEMKARLGGIVEWASSDAGCFDLVVAVHGCETACADLTAFDGYEIHPIASPEDADRFVAHMRVKASESMLER